MHTRHVRVLDKREICARTRQTHAAIAYAKRARMHAQVYVVLMYTETVDINRTHLQYVIVVVGVANHPQQLYYHVRLWGLCMRARERIAHIPDLVQVSVRMRLHREYVFN